VDVVCYSEKARDRGDIDNPLLRNLISNHSFNLEIFFEAKDSEFSPNSRVIA
jgi:hypothetical protein